MLFHFVLGFLIKIISGLDDTFTRIPILASLTRKHEGRIAFSIGTLMATLLVIGIASTFSHLIEPLPYTNYISAALLIGFAIAIYFDLLHAPKQERLTIKLFRPKMTAGRYLQLIGTGFIVSLTTMIDDSLLLIPLFFGDFKYHIAAAAGILAATFIGIVFVIFGSTQLSRIPYRREIASVSLFIFGLLFLFKII